MKYLLEGSIHVPDSAFVHSDDMFRVEVSTDSADNKNEWYVYIAVKEMTICLSVSELRQLLRCIDVMPFDTQ